MNLTEYKTFKEAITLARAGQKERAYQDFKALHAHAAENVELLIWTAYTTPDLQEAALFIASAALLEPGNDDVVHAQRWLVAQKTARGLSAMLAQG